MPIFRYPGGKSRLLPHILPRLNVLAEKESGYHDVFVGGGSVALAFAKCHPDLKISLNDADKNIYAFWSVVCGQVDGLRDLLERVRVKPTVELFRELRQREPSGFVERAYYALFFNRTTFSGIYNSGPIGGYSQTGKSKVDCRYNPEGLVSEILGANNILAGRTCVFNLLASDYLRLFGGGAMYLDPPYFEKGKQLYTVAMTAAEHRALSLSLRELDNWLLSYDSAPEIESLYSGWARVEAINARYSIRDHKTDWRKKSELLISPLSAPQSALSSPAMEMETAQMPVGLSYA